MGWTEDGTNRRWNRSHNVQGKNIMPPEQHRLQEHKNNSFKLSSYTLKQSSSEVCYESMYIKTRYFYNVRMSAE